MNIPIEMLCENGLRPCFVRTIEFDRKTFEFKNGETKKALFHYFIKDRIKYLKPSEIECRRRDHWIKEEDNIYAVVEYEDGSLDIVDIACINFVDTKSKMLEYFWPEESSKDDQDKTNTCIDG